MYCSVESHVFMWPKPTCYLVSIFLSILSLPTSALFYNLISLNSICFPKDSIMFNICWSILLSLACPPLATLLSLLSSIITSKIFTWPFSLGQVSILFLPLNSFHHFVLNPSPYVYLILEYRPHLNVEHPLFILI